MLFAHHFNRHIIYAPNVRHSVMQSILIDVSRVVARSLKGLLPTGVDRVCLAYIEYYNERARAVLCEGRLSAVLSKNDSKLIFNALSNPSKASQKLIKKLVLKARCIGWARALMPYKKSILINVSHTGLDHPEYAMMLRKHGALPVFMVHDLIPITHPEYARIGDFIQHQARMLNALKLGAGIISNSQYTLDSFQDFANKHKLTPPQAIVAPLSHGINSQKVITQNSPYPTPYFVMLGTIEPRKNHWLLLQVWRRLIEQLGDQAPKLVIIGRRGWECENIIDLLERCEILKSHVIELEMCSDQELTNILHYSNALLFPTFTEGFGLPIAEALDLNVPVIASNLSVFREFAHDVPEYIDPLDAIKWLTTIIEYNDLNHPKRLAQIERIKTLTLPTWQQHFAQVDKFIASLHP
jgi:glycosyltransferase involved in cell wall biosynthesis